MIGGYALSAFGYQGGTTDIDVIVRPTREQGERVRNALLLLPDHASQDIQPDWFEEGETIREADEFVVDLMFTACGKTYESLLPQGETIDLDGIPVHTLDLRGMLKTKQTAREKD